MAHGDFLIGHPSAVSSGHVTLPSPICINQQADMSEEPTDGDRAESVRIKERSFELYVMRRNACSHTRTRVHLT